MFPTGISSRFACAVALLMASVAGCKPTAVTDTAQIDPTHERLAYIGIAYREFLDKNGRPPAKEDDLKKTLTDETVWFSARDQQPFVVVWNVDLTKVPPGTIYAYEKIGKGGKRLVRTAVGSTEEMDSKTFMAATFPPGHTLQP